jgi:hypothetical protein
MKSEAMDENLVGYLLEALDPATHREVSAHLEAHPEARARLELLRRALSPLALDRDEPPLPPGLLIATLGRVAEHRCRRLPDAPAPSPRQVGARGRRWPRRVDLAAAAVLLVLVGGLAAPLLVRQWFGYRRTACADNLRRFWVSLVAYSDRNDGAFPRVEREGPHAVAGIFVPLLRDEGVLGEVSVGCPAQGPKAPPHHSVRDLEELFGAHPDDFQRAAHGLAGDYAYSLGYWEDGSHRHLRLGDDEFPILADRSDAKHGNSPNHGGAGQNVLYVGGRVAWCVTPTVGVGGDHIYLNRDKPPKVAAGLGRSDTVLAPGGARP